MKEPVNQLEEVRGVLESTPRDEWAAIAKAAGISKRHLYNVAKNSGSPSYDIVHTLLRVFEARRLARRNKRVEVQP